MDLQWAWQYSWLRAATMILAGLARHSLILRVARTARLQVDRILPGSFLLRVAGTFLRPWHENAALGHSHAYALLRGILDAVRAVLVSAGDALRRGRDGSALLRRSNPGAFGQGSLLLRGAGILAESARKDYGLFLLIFFVPFLPTVLIMAALTGIFVWRLGSGSAAGRRDWQPVPVAAPLVLFGLALVYGTVVSVSPGLSMQSLIGWGMALMALLLARELLSYRQVTSMALGALFLSTILVSAAGLYQFATGVQTPASWIDVETNPGIQTRIFSVFDNPTMLAQFLALVVPLALFFALEAPSRRQKGLGALALLMSAAALILTFSRGGWISAALGTAWYGASRQRWLIALMLLVALAAPILLPDAVLGRVESIGSLGDSSNRYRVTIWKATTQMFRDFWPTGIGLGVGAFAAVYPQYVIAGTKALHSHNLYLELGIELGILGLVFFLWLQLLVFKQATDGTTGLNPFRRGLAAALLGGLAGQLAQALVDHIWYSPKLLIFTFLLMGWALAAAHPAPAVSRRQLSG